MEPYIEKNQVLTPKHFEFLSLADSCPANKNK
jgi:hypothetical protein